MPCCDEHIKVVSAISINIKGHVSSSIQDVHLHIPSHHEHFMCAWMLSTCRDVSFGLMLFNAFNVFITAACGGTQKGDHIHSSSKHMSRLDHMSFPVWLL